MDGALENQTWSSNWIDRFRSRLTDTTLPPRQLRAFQKVYLEPGEERTLSFTLLPRDFAWFDPDTNDWRVTPGAYRIHLGTSSRDLPLDVDMEIQA